MQRFVLLALLLLPAVPLAAQPFPPPAELPRQTDLPELFVTFDGERITTPRAWRERRRPELQALVQHYMYGVLPPPPDVAFDVRVIDPEALDGKASLKEVEIRFPELPADAPALHLLVALPNDGTAPAPVFLGLNKCGNHTVLGHPGIPRHERDVRHEACAEDAYGSRGARTSVWEVETLVDRGYGFATFWVNDMDPDLDDLTDGIHAYYPQPELPPGARWGAIAAWAWGIHRAVDYLTTDPDVDPERIAAVGHSRRGKTVLLATALDERIALVVPHQSGTGGMALSRNNDQETVERITRVFPHWFAGHFAAFGDDEARLPFDQHALVALVAPRPLLDTGGLEDTWANYESALRTIRAADTVYNFLGAPGIVGEAMIEEKPLAGQEFGSLLQYRLDTGHVLNRAYWNGILDFADRNWGVPASGSGQVSDAEPWPEGFALVHIPNPTDGHRQLAYVRAARRPGPRPLVVSLHSWSADYRQQSNSLAEQTAAREWHYIHPDFRGPNRHPDACCSDRVVEDLDAAIAYARAHMDVDPTQIHVIGGSGGGYASLCYLMRGRVDPVTVSAWVPITDLEAWHDQTRARGLRYAADIRACTDSGEQLDVEEARRRSPFWMDAPRDRLNRTRVRLFAGVHDGYTGSVPITQSLRFYNKLVDEAGLGSPEDRVRDDEIIHLLSHRTAPAPTGRRLGDRPVVLYRRAGPLEVTIFEGGHEMLDDFALDLLDSTGDSAAPEPP